MTGLPAADALVECISAPMQRYHALNQALKLYREQSQWSAMMRNAMHCEFGWDTAARAYLELYRQVVARRKG